MPNLVLSSPHEIGHICRMISTTRNLLSHPKTRPALRPGNAYNIREVRGIVVHWTANTRPGADAAAHRSYFNQGLRSASAHYVVDSRTVLQCIPDTEVAFHCGDRPEKKYREAGLIMIAKSKLTPNYFTIGVEMCVNSDGHWPTTYDYTVNLCASLLLRHNLTVRHLFRHFDITGKACPRPLLQEALWQAFKQHVSEAYITLEKMKPRQAVVNTKGLNVRSGPSLSFPVLYSFLLNEPVTIFETSPNQWARIGVGEWVHSKFLS